MSCSGGTYGMKDTRPAPRGRPRRPSSPRPPAPRSRPRRRSPRPSGRCRVPRLARRSRRPPRSRLRAPRRQRGPPRPARGRDASGVAPPLPAPAGGVVGEEAAFGPSLVEPAEERNNDESLQRQREVPPDHLCEAIRLSLQGQAITGDLLAVLALELEELDDLDGLAGRPRYRDRRVLVGRDALLDPVVGYRVALGRAPVPSHPD